MEVRGIVSPLRSRPSNYNQNSKSSSKTRGIISPLRSRPSINPNVKPNSKQPKPTSSTAIKTNNAVKSSKPKPISVTTPNPDSHKKLVVNNSPKPSPRARTASKPISQRTFRLTPSKRNLKPGIAACSVSRSDQLSSSAAKDAGQSATNIQDLDVHDQLLRVSIDSKDLASIDRQENSIHGSDTKEYNSSQRNDSRMFQIYKKIASHRQENSSVTSYFTKLKALWDELATFNTNLPQCSYGDHMEREKVMQFLLGLNDSYSIICNEILLTNPFPTVENAYWMVIHYEVKRRAFLAALQMKGKKIIENNLLDLQNQNAHSNNVDNNELPPLSHC